MNSSCISKLCVLAAGLAAASASLAQTTTGATFGSAISLSGGTPSDLVLDESRHVVYLISNTLNQVQIFDYTVGMVTGTIGVCTTPLAGALSMESVPQYLYVTCNGTSGLAQIDLTQNRVVQTVGLPSKPQGVAVGIDGRVLVSMSGTGVVNGVPQGTLSLFDPALTGTQNLLPVSVPALPGTPANLPVPALPPAVTTFTSKLQRTPDGNYIIGVITPTNATTYVFVYEVSSGIVLRNRTSQGTSSVLSVSPDGSRFMAGLTMFDTSTLSVIAQENIANAPFVMANNFNSAQGIGGSVFAPDGKTLYAAFNTQPTTTPASPPNSSTLLLNDPANLGIRLGIKLKEAIIAKIVMKADGSEAWALSASGMMDLPLGHLYDNPIIVPDTTAVFLAMDDCNRGLAQAAVKVNNIGGGKLTYSVAADTASAALVYQQSSGLAPSAITFTMEPGRSGVSRFAGTNLWSGAGTQSGTPYTLTLTSPNAINIPNTIKVYMNFRQSDQRGQIFPVPTTRNSNPSGTTSSGTATNEGLQDLVLDEGRGRLYISNSGYNRIEVFDTANQVFLAPIPVGQMPHQMAMSSDGNTLYVGNTGGESISIVDLNLQQVIGNVTFPAVPRNGTVTPIFPRSLALGLFGLQFVMSNGGQWEVVSNNALPRAANTSVIPITLAGCPNCGMAASPDGSWIVTLSGDGHAYVYNGMADTYITGRLLFPTIQGYYGPLAVANSGTFFTANTLALSQSLNTMAGAATPSGVAVVTTPRNVWGLVALSDHQYLRITTPVRTSVTATGTDDSRATVELVDLTAGTDTLAAVAPENPWISVFGTTRTNVQPRLMVVDSAGTTAYVITISGLSVVPLVQGAAAPVIAPVNGIVNSTDGTANIQPGTFITLRGQNLASKAVATTVPPPAVLGGSCVTFGDVSVPLLQSSSGQILAQVPDTLPAGTQVVQVRSLALAQDSAPVTVIVRPSGTPSKPGSGGTSEKPGDPRRPVQGKQ
ncbi:MAG TPA: hypothetical protein VN736_04025 [Candidatus Limnocylindrales bacterium]|nr:hypothetical protein [Candidatus Limnocylindrales bacterium]